MILEILFEMSHLAQRRRVSLGKGETTVIRNYVPITRPFVGGFPQEPLFFLTLFSI